MWTIGNEAPVPLFRANVAATVRADRVLHDWRDEDCLRILRACRAAMGPEALLLIGELILDPGPARGRPTGYLHDMQMMTTFGSARERTEAEFRGLLAEAGFALRRAIPTGRPSRSSKRFLIDVAFGVTTRYRRLPVAGPLYGLQRPECPL
jgi:hypothetical protein